MTNRTRRQLASAFGWGLSLGGLVAAAGIGALVFSQQPSRALVVLVSMSFAASATGVILSWRVARARAFGLRDPLTGLPNRVLLEDRIEQALRRSERSGESFAVVLIDLDGFKDVNDVRGHAAGDVVLKALARRFEALLRSSDTVARVGGDEFVVLSPTTGDDEHAALLAGRLRHAVRRPFRVGGASIEIDGSIGWAIAPADGRTASDLLVRADGQMYATKRETADDALLLSRGVDAGVVRDLESAVEHDQLVVLYQPIIDLRTGETRGAEALVRRLLPDHELLLPSEFVPHVERTPLVRELTFAVITDALESAARWRDAGHDLSVSVNVPYRLLDDAAFVDGLVSLLRSEGVTPSKLTLEVVPSGPEAGSVLDLIILTRLTDMGVRLSLDDCGRSGSFAPLRVLPLNELKIDAGLVHGIARSSTDAVLVRGLVDIGHALGLKVVAEGVESRETWDTLARWRCDYAQGFFVATPRPARELTDWLARRWPEVA